jgi:hypothetical protein
LKSASLGPAQGVIKQQALKSSKSICMGKNIPFQSSLFVLRSDLSSCLDAPAKSPLLPKPSDLMGKYKNFTREEMCGHLKAQNRWTASWNVHYKKPVTEKVSAGCWSHTVFDSINSRLITSVHAKPPVYIRYFSSRPERIHELRAWRAQAASSFIAQGPRTCSSFHYIFFSGLPVFEWWMLPYGALQRPTMVTDKNFGWCKVYAGGKVSKWGAYQPFFLIKLQVTKSFIKDMFTYM